MKMKLKAVTAAAASPLLAATLAAAQTHAIDHLTQAQLRQMAPALEARARAQGGSASVKLATYPNHLTMVALRVKSGGAEVHAHYADIFYVVRGHATLVTNGKVLDPENKGEGETIGAGLEGGSRQPLNPGDFVHIPAGVPHQLLLLKGGVFEYYVIKVKEN